MSLGTVAPATAAEAVANGAQLLDERVPDWWRQIDLGKLSLCSCRDCVCGQLAWEAYARDMSSDEDELYERFLAEVLGLEEDMYHGFNEHWRYNFAKTHSECAWTFGELDAEWRKVIDSRLQADVLVPTKKEEVLA